ncbi:hypothetical protein C8F01DRAFT_1284654 [Mycena amicta]|nr:hypothetical protein C8F01DRAFT_1284654 [Mycena amicta]
MSVSSSDVDALAAQLHGGLVLKQSAQQRPPPKKKFVVPAVRVNELELLFLNNKPLLFVGESHSRSLPIALVVKRGSWDGIYASAEPEPGGTVSKHPWKLEGTTNEERMAYAQEDLKTRVDLNKKLKRSLPAQNLAIFASLTPEEFTAIDARFSLIIDARNLPAVGTIPCAGLADSYPELKCTHEMLQTIWFQWPWGWYTGNQIESLIIDFIESAGRVQQVVDAIILDLTSGYYSKYYGDPAKMKQKATEAGYDLVVERDSVFIQRAIDAGYVHIGMKDSNIHAQLLNEHETYMWVKRRAPEVKTRVH